MKHILAIICILAISNLLYANDVTEQKLPLKYFQFGMDKKAVIKVIHRNIKSHYKESADGYLNLSDNIFGLKMVTNLKFDKVGILNEINMYKNSKKSNNEFAKLFNGLTTYYGKYNGTYISGNNGMMKYSWKFKNIYVFLDFEVLKNDDALIELTFKHVI
jgi:hypothetical protein